MQQPEPYVPRKTPAEFAEMGSDALLTELSVTFEELKVAEEELRVQHDELLRAHEALAAEGARYRELFEHAPVAYIVTDPRGVISDVNRAAERLLRCPARRLARKPLAVYTQDLSRRRIRRAMTQLYADGDSLTTTFNIHTRDGRKRRVEAMISVIRDITGENIGLRWLLVDRTRRLRRERMQREHAAELESLVAIRTAELERAQQVKDQLIATVSHEFRTALAAIGGYAELLEMGVHGELTREQGQDIRRIHSAYHHLARVVDDLLSYSRLVSGRLSVEINHIIVQDVVRGVVDMVVPLAHAKNIALDVDEGDATLTCAGDGERVKQILINLLGNAIKFTPAGGRVRLSARSIGDAAEIVVADTGLGIPPDSLETVFEPFVRLRNSASERGTGLGLSISRDLARAMGGTLTVASVLGEGSRFTLTLPRSTPLAGEARDG